MRFQNYLNEAGTIRDISDKELEDTIDLIKQECQSFLKDLKGNHLIYSGRRKESDFYIIKDVQKRKRKWLFLNLLINHYLIEIKLNF